MAVDATLAEWLKAPALFAAATDPAITAAWGDRAAISEFVSPFASRSDAEAEGARQLAFLGVALALDQHVVAGDHRNQLGRVIELDGRGLDYADGVVAFVIRVEGGDGFTILDVLRPL